MLTYSLAARRSLTKKPADNRLANEENLDDLFPDVDLQEEDDHDNVMNAEQVQQLFVGLTDALNGLAAAAAAPQPAGAGAGVAADGQGPAHVQGGSKKLDPLDSTVGIEWISWKETFEQVSNINGWDDLRKRRELRAAMKGAAARHIRDIVVTPPALAQGAVAPAGRIDTIEAALEAYEARFIPPAAGRVAKLEYDAARHQPHELVAEWHGRLRELFIRAYPGQAVETSAFLIQHFAMHMIDETVAGFVVDRDPQTYTMAGDYAQQKAATNMAFAAKHRAGNLNNIGLHALNDGTNGQARVCWHCQGPHLRGDCPAYKKSLEKERPRSSRDGRWQRRTRGTGPQRTVKTAGQTGGRKPGNPGPGRRSGGGAYRPRVNQLGGPAEEPWSEGEDQGQPDQERQDARQEAPVTGNGQGR